MGRGNRIFRILKFRSMRVEATDANGARSASRDDDRITRVGKFIRATSIDERSEEHTSELQSLMRISYAVLCLKKKKQLHTTHNNTNINRKSNPSEAL